MRNNKTIGLRKIGFKVALLIAVLAATFLTNCRRTTTTHVEANNLSSMMQSFASAIAEKTEASENNPVYFSMLTPVNNTTRQIPLNALESLLVRYLLEKNVYAVRREGRDDTIKELELALAGLVERGIIAGTLASPQYFLKLSIDEEQQLRAGRNAYEKLVYTYYSLELREAATQKVLYSGRKGVQKKTKERSTGVTF